MWVVDFGGGEPRSRVGERAVILSDVAGAGARRRRTPLRGARVVRNVVLTAWEAVLAFVAVALAGAVGRALVAQEEGFELAPAYAVRGAAWCVAMATHAVASLVSRQLADAKGRAKVRALAQEHGFAVGGDVALLWDLVRAVEDGRLVVVRVEAPAHRLYQARAPGGDAAEADERGAAPDLRSHWVAVRVVDDDSAEPVAGLELAVVLPDRSEHAVTTDGDGRVELRSAEEGSCDVRTRSEGEYFALCVTFVGSGRAFRREAAGAATRALVPRGRPARSGKRALLDVLAVHVGDGETWGSIAERHGVSPEALMRFNFDTADPAEIQVAMSEHLGCWRRDPDSGRLVFSADDDPGVLLVPRPWQHSVTTGHEHVLRVRAVRAPARPYLFSV